MVPRVSDNSLVWIYQKGWHWKVTMETFCTILLWVCIPYSSMNTSIIPSPAVGGKESYSLNIYDIQNQFIGKI